VRRGEPCVLREFSNRGSYIAVDGFGLISRWSSISLKQLRSSRNHRIASPITPASVNASSRMPLGKKSQRHAVLLGGEWTRQTLRKR